VAVGITYVAWHSPQGPARAPVATIPDIPIPRAPTVPPSEPSPAPSASAEPNRAEADALRASPQANAYEQSLALRDRIRGFFDRAATLSAQDRLREALALAATVLDEERAGRLLPTESLFIQISLLRYTSDDEAEQRAQGERLTAEYRARSAETERAGLAKIQSNPAFTAYKQREAEIIREVQTLPTIPGDRSRDDYLRERLEQARIEAFEAARKAGSTGKAQ
jgi:hypothetical protein